MTNTASKRVGAELKIAREMYDPLGEEEVDEVVYPNPKLVSRERSDQGTEAQALACPWDAVTPPGVGAGESF